MVDQIVSGGGLGPGTPDAPPAPEVQAIQAAQAVPAAADVETEAPPSDDTTVPAAVEVEDEEEDEAISFDDPYIDTPLCTTCDECTGINKKMFAYNENKQAFIKDPSAGTYAELVRAAEKCPVHIIHPGKPKNPDEPDLDKLLERAASFN